MKQTFSCSACGHLASKWFGKCPECGDWSTAVAPGANGSSAGLEVVSLDEAPEDAERAPTGIDEIDRVLGGGLVRGSAVLLAGEPGIGKSTLTLQLIAALAHRACRTLLVSGEESVAQIGGRAKRLGTSSSQLQIATSGSLDAVIATSISASLDVLVVDSIQTLADDRLEQPPGSMVQVRECAAALTRHAKSTGTTVILVGHVTKEGSVAGPKTLEHVVDVVLSLEGERGGTLRLLRSAKNRYGATDETGVFVMSTDGLDPVGDPSAFLLADRRPGVAGSVVFPGMEGTRPLLVEVQALVDESKIPQPRRVAIGLDGRRLSLLAAVMSQTGLSLGASDVFVAAAGGLDVREPAADLAMCLALFSAITKSPIGERAVAVGEVGLSGEIRRVPAIARRLSEARRLGFDTAFVPFGFDEHVKGLKLIRVPDIAAAFQQARGAATHV
jgi:DNA repair protein RadA/Sms